MERYFTEFRVDILDLPFIGDNFKTEKTTKISLYDNQNQLVDEFLLGYIHAEQVYSQLESQKTLNFPFCYVEGFSLGEYRKSRNIDSGYQIMVKELNCENTFFGCPIENEAHLDFSNVLIGSETANFRNCTFSGYKSVSFDNSTFKGNVNFEYALFNYLDVSFSNIKFHGEQVTFKNVIFKTGLKKFESNTYRCKEVLFVNTEFDEGDVIFSDSDFGSGEIDFKVSRFGNGRIDFNKVNFGNGTVNFEKAEFGEGNVNFRSAIFGGNVEFPRCVFGSGDISFIGTTFERGEISFAGTEFGKGKLIFKQAFFGGEKLDFHYAHFDEGDITFERSEVAKGNVDFRAVDFGTGKITFNRVNFGPGEVSFEASELKKGKIAFRKTVFGAGVFNFEMADYRDSELIVEDVDFGSGKVSFKKSKFGLLSLESSQMNNYFDLRVDECGKLDLSNTIVKDIIDIDSADAKTNIRELDLSGIRLLGRIYLDWRQNNVKQLILKQNTSNANKAAQFRILKQNYNLNGQYEYEDEAYVEFKRCESKSIRESSETKSFLERIRANISYFFQLVIFDKVGNYATNPLRVLLSMTFAYVLFSFLYVIISLYTNDSSIHSSLFQLGDPRDLTIVQKSFYHSAVTFLTIGYGDYYPSGIIRILSGVEGFTGLFLMSYFTVAFVRKILR